MTVSTASRLLYRYRKYDGGGSAPLEREIFQRGPAALSYPMIQSVTPLLWWNSFAPVPCFREKPWQVEPIAGICDVGELQATERREARGRPLHPGTSCQPARIW